MIKRIVGRNSYSKLAKQLVTFNIPVRHGFDGQSNPGCMKDETAVLAAASSLDQDALATIFDEYAPAIYKYLLRLGVSPQEADQFAGDGFVRLLEPVQSRAEETMLLERLAMVMERELTEDQRNVIVLRFQEEFSLKETAEIIGKNVNAVKALQNRGIQKLRQVMSSMGGDL